MEGGQGQEKLWKRCCKELGKEDDCAGKMQLHRIFYDLKLIYL